MKLCFSQENVIILWVRLALEIFTCPRMYLKCSVLGTNPAVKILSIEKSMYVRSQIPF